MRGVRAAMAGLAWAAALAAVGQGIPMYREWDAVVRFDGMESGEVGLDEALRLELRATPLREGIASTDPVLGFSKEEPKRVRALMDAAVGQSWKMGMTTGSNGRDTSEKKTDDDWILAAVRQADGASSSNHPSLAGWLVGGNEAAEDGWGWLAGGVQADAEGRAAEAKAGEAESQAWEGEVGDALASAAERRRGGEQGGGAEGSRAGMGGQGNNGMGMNGESGAAGAEGAAGMAGAGWRTENKNAVGTMAGNVPGNGAEGVGVASKGEGENGVGEMSRTRAALEMAGMKTDVWKPEGGDRRFATEGLGADWKALTAGASGGALAGGPGGDGGGGGEGVGSGRSGGGTGGEPSRARAGSGWSMPSAAESGRGWSMGSAPGRGESGGWSFGAGGASGAGGSGLPGMGQGVESRERWGGGWVVGGGAGGGGFGSGIGGGAGAGSGWGGYRSQVDAGGGVSVPAQRSGGGAAWEAWQKRGENSGGGFTPVWR